MTLSAIVSSMDWPVIEIPTGWAAPVFVPGAITKMSHAMAIKNPADADRDPLGNTYATVGTFEFNIFSMISRMEVSRPPGVFNVIRRREACSFSAFWMAFWIYSEVTGWMGALIVILKIDEYPENPIDRIRKSKTRFFFTLRFIIGRPTLQVNNLS